MPSIKLHRIIYYDLKNKTSEDFFFIKEENAKAFYDEKIKELSKFEKLEISDKSTTIDQYQIDGNYYVLCDKNQYNVNCFYDKTFVDKEDAEEELRKYNKWLVEQPFGYTYYLSSIKVKDVNEAWPYE